MIEVLIAEDGNNVTLFWNNRFMLIINLPCLQAVINRVILSVKLWIGMPSKGWLACVCVLHIRVCRLVSVRHQVLKITDASLLHIRVGQPSEITESPKKRLAARMARRKYSQHLDKEHGQGYKHVTSGFEVSNPESNNRANYSRTDWGSSTSFATIIANTAM
jgi:hypothetical protein